MGQMNISITEPLKNWCEARVAEGRYSSTSDYVRDLIRRDQDEAMKLAQLRAEIAKGDASGISDLTLDDIVTKARKRTKSKSVND